MGTIFSAKTKNINNIIHIIDVEPINKLSSQQSDSEYESDSDDEININFEDNYEDKEYNCEKIMIQSMHHSNI